MIALMPLPGSPGYGGKDDLIIAQALSDLGHYTVAGVDAIILENSQIIDIPGRLEDSLIGRNVEVTCGESRPAALRLLLGDDSQISLI